VSWRPLTASAVNCGFDNNLVVVTFNEVTDRKFRKGVNFSVPENVVHRKRGGGWKRRESADSDQMSLKVME
jgi:hypothetical protein